ncbi:MAG: adenosine kinase [Bacteriovorax sp.]|jgi:sugar/nucleoside kinase (ribokinase family)
MAKKYDVYGIGNALVDMEFEVTTDFLQKASIEKGLMTLVDEARQTEIITTLHGIQHKRTCGGSAANTMIAVSQFGGKSFYSCKVASDETGDFYFKDLMDNGVDTNLSTSSLEPGITGKCIVLITPDADRTMNTFLGITQTLSSKELIEENIKNSNYVYIEGYLVASPTGKEAAIKARKIAEANNVKTALTFSDVNMVHYFNDGLVEMLGNGVDLLFCNEAEAYTFTKTNNVQDAASALKKVAKTFSITLGAKGAFVFDGHKEIYVVTTPVEAVDTNGAGDLFAGAFLYAINSGISFPEAAKLGCTASSLLVTQFGARLQKEQVLEIKSKTL